MIETGVVKDSSYAILSDKIRSKQAIIGVIGMGYVGLPLAMELATADFSVIGVDIDALKIEKLADGKSHIIDIPTDRVQAVIADDKFLPTTDYATLKAADVISICVPTPLTKSHEPNMSYIEDTVARLKPVLSKGTLLVLESTTYPGTTRELIACEFEKDGWVIGEDIFICFSPERIDPGNKQFQPKQVPKVVGGMTEKCLALGQQYYAHAFDTIVPVSTPEIAEMTKLLENTFRSINIAFINEMSMLCEELGIDLWEAIDAAKTKPFGFMPFYPGPGVGGHCIPLDPMYLYWKGKEKNFFSRFIELAQQVNTSMPKHVVELASQALNRHGKALSTSKVLLVGVAYKSDIDDVRESPGLHVYEQLKQADAQLDVLDPFVTIFRDEAGRIVRPVSVVGNMSDYDCAIIMTKHSNIDYDVLLKSCDCIIDTRNVWTEKKANVFKIGGV
ncbi:nucleotide sugar dehydrogenase [Listeria sp. SHR_NRA_18]|uniref:nucleotide sugar dehydrogenase n=1 Tax=Listeria TaxID=1637 RepID=UPI000A718232|nr:MULTISPECIES: nucleotide sugar dehydrogenase [Listeria]RQW67508.1 nucleotide sugar dehydrogenase [Listeria sp. SHR_NRA_18]WAO22647.1 nucleotide sugar dehydrogenase [Listeria newyorkensis]SQC51585.1 UDP-glucose 6-dehydrogenase tuaD [Listeria newyorkensis]